MFLFVGLGGGGQNRRTPFREFEDVTGTIIITIWRPRKALTGVWRNRGPGPNPILATSFGGSWLSRSRLLLCQRGLCRLPLLFRHRNRGHRSSRPTALGTRRTLAGHRHTNRGNVRINWIPLEPTLLWQDGYGDPDRNWIATLDPDRNWIACFIHDTGFDHNRSRARQAQFTS